MDSTYFTHKLASIVTANPNLPITYTLEGDGVFTSLAPKGITYSPDGITVTFIPKKEKINGSNH